MNAGELIFMARALNAYHNKTQQLQSNPSGKICMNSL